MKEPTKLLTPYEEMHRSFILRLIELKDKRGNLKELSEFLRLFAGIHSSIEQAQVLKPRYANTLRIRVRLFPRTILGEDSKELEPDWIIDFLFFDHYKGMGGILDALCLEEKDFPEAKKALIHFGCSPDSYGGDFARNAFVAQSSPYDSYRSIDPFDMAAYLGDGFRFNEKFFEVYAGIIGAFAKKKAIETNQRNARAFAFLCQNVLAEELKKRIDKGLVVETHHPSKGEAIVYFSLPNYEWNLVDEEGEPLGSIYGLTLNIHFIAGEPFAHLGLSHRGPVKAIPLNEEPISKELYEECFYKKIDLSQTRFIWASTIEDPLDDEFAYSNRPLWIFDPWEDENPDKHLGRTPQERCGFLVDEIAEIFEELL